MSFKEMTTKGEIETSRALSLFALNFFFNQIKINNKNKTNYSFINELTIPSEAIFSLSIHRIHRVTPMDR